MDLPKETIYFDTETLSLNPYSFEAKLIATQIGTCINGYFESEVCCEWNNINGEINLIESINKRFNMLPRFTPVFTYNGLFDIFYIYVSFSIFLIPVSLRGELSPDHDLSAHGTSLHDLVQGPESGPSEMDAPLDRVGDA